LLKPEKHHIVTNLCEIMAEQFGSHLTVHQNIGLTDY